MLAEDEYYLGCQTDPFRSEKVDEEQLEEKLINRSMLNASSCNLPSHNTRWNEEETMKLMEAIRKFGLGKWMEIANHVGTRNALQVKNRARHVLYYKRVVESRENHESNGWTNCTGIEDNSNIFGEVMIDRPKVQAMETSDEINRSSHLHRNSANQKPYVNESEDFLPPQIPKKLESINPIADEIILEDETSELTSLENMLESNPLPVEEHVDRIGNSELENGIQQKHHDTYELMNEMEFDYPLEQKVNTSNCYG